MTEKKKVTNTKPKRRRGRPRKKVTPKPQSQCCDQSSRCCICPCKLFKKLVCFVRSLFS